MSESLQLIQSVADGKSKAFQQLYEMFSEQVYNTALSYVQNVEDAEEVTQDVFTNVFRSAGKFKGDSQVSTWIYRITINAALGLIRKRKRFAFLKFGETEKDVPDFEHPGVLLENKENAKALFKVIDTLPETQKTAFILSFVEGLPRQEVADVMETSLKSIEALLQRGKRSLRGKLEDSYPNRGKNKR